MGVAEAIIAGALISTAGSLGAAALSKPDIPFIPATNQSKLADERKRKINASQISAAQRFAGLGTIQLRAPTLTI